MSERRLTIVAMKFGVASSRRTRKSNGRSNSIIHLEASCNLAEIVGKSLMKYRLRKLRRKMFIL